jgi:hexosaminidase
MIDTARHYIPVNKILQIIKAMSSIKLNVLHWHIVDAQSFPLVVPDAPELAKKGAFAPRAVYTTDDIDMIVKTAKLNGIRVIHEYDTPGHAAAWGFGYPEITAKCPSYSKNINNIPLDPTNEKTYQILDAVISTASAHVPDKYMHFGGDELVMGCWKEDPNIVKFMQQKGWTDYNQLLGYYVARLEPIYRKYNKVMISWEELLLEHGSHFKLPNDTIVQSWRSKQALGQIVQAGHRGLLSAGWYLDKEVPGNGTHYEWVDTWKDFYANDPTSGMGFTPAQEALVLGGEATMWAEQVDVTNYDSRVFPRVLAIAERLWSNASDTQDITEATIRLSFARCHVLVRRGIRAGPILSDYCDATEQYY